MFESIFGRIIVAVIVVVVLLALIAPVFRVIGFPVTPDLLLIIRICIAAIAALYIWRGSTWFA